MYAYVYMNEVVFMNLEKGKGTVITCPHCGYEYLPGEIFYAEALVGRPTDIVRDVLGKILYYEYKPDYELDPVEHYICDGCGKSFVIEANTTYKAKQEQAELDFTDSFSSLLED